MKTRILFLMIAFAACAIAQQAFSVVVNKDNPAASVNKAQLRKMMMGETAAWPGGAKVLILIGPAGDASRSAALKEICGMSESDYSKQALQVSFAGGGKSPVRTLPSTAAVRQAVALSPGALGIVEGTQGGPGLKILPVE
ncbi:MAG TPA: hypothetical protein VHW09_16320 [Bryobacteraceae bacterium]|jgi:ABC-type phosphate transport system substrate-binding protein|nr:hypothetical protein [Bryobacteraceae bacterium]